MDARPGVRQNQRTKIRAKTLSMKLAHNLAAITVALRRTFSSLSCCGSLITVYPMSSQNCRDCLLLDPARERKKKSGWWSAGWWSANWQDLRNYMHLRVRIFSLSLSRSLFHASAFSIFIFIILMQADDKKSRKKSPAKAKGVRGVSKWIKLNQMYKCAS